MRTTAGSLAKENCGWREVSTDSGKAVISGRNKHKAFTNRAHWLSIQSSRHSDVGGRIRKAGRNTIRWLNVGFARQRCRWQGRPCYRVRVCSVSPPDWHGIAKDTVVHK